MKVVCIDPSRTKMLRMGATYTVIGEHPGCKCSGPAYVLAEVGIYVDCSHYRWVACPKCQTTLDPKPYKTVYSQRRFVPLDPPKVEREDERKKELVT